ncbi:C6 finger domain protein [Penicillium herquei]|nr:C6 finger domain protein [Penicillium herquei]
MSPDSGHCDENQPTCVNCQVTRRDCSHEKLTPKLPLSVKKSRSELRSSPKNNDSSTDNFSASSSTDDAAVHSPPVNVFHLELFNHFIKNISEILGFEPTALGISGEDMMKYALNSPFLMNQILALSALHLSVTRPAQSPHCKIHATQLQNHAIVGFNAIESDTDKSMEKILPNFLFSSLLAHQTVCESLVFHDYNFEVFLDNFGHSLRLHRGIRAVIYRSWDRLLDSPLGPLLEIQGKALEKDTPGCECLALFALLENDTIDQNTKNTYSQAIDALQKVFDAVCDSSLPSNKTGSIVSWQVMIPDGYIDLLMERRPEALIILSHFATILHTYRDTWLFGNSGEFIVRSVEKYLGLPWERWLQWPNRAVMQNDL